MQRMERSERGGRGLGNMQETVEWLWVCGRMLRETAYWNFQGKSIKHFDGLQLCSMEWLFLAAYTRLRLDHWDPGFIFYSFNRKT